MVTFRNCLLLALLYLTSVVPSSAQELGAGAAVRAPADVGANTRIGLGYDSRHKLGGDIMQVLRDDGRSTVIGEGWIGRDAGGLKLNYHWLGDDATRVGKVFAAWDRNAYDDQKVTLGGGAENEDWFWGAYGSLGITGRRLSGSHADVVVRQISDVAADIGPFVQDVTTTTTTRIYERAYDYGVGGRVGHFYDRSLLRLTAGLDYEWGEASSSQATISVGLEKLFANSPHSLLITASASDRRGDYEVNRHDQRIGVYWRYQFGAAKTAGAGAVAAPVRALPVASVPAEEPVPPGKKVVEVVETVAAETFFDLDKSTLRPEAGRVLDDLVKRMRHGALRGELRVVGHTCDLGPERYNQRLSERRAAAVKDYLVATGVLSAEQIRASGKGELEPRYPNTPDQRHLNRRCEIEFSLVVEREDEASLPGRPAPAVVPVVSDTQPAEESSRWRLMALRNPVDHKREVDVYRQQEKIVQVEPGPRVSLNQAPVAVDDIAVLLGSRLPGAIDVLANDSDPDGNPLTIVEVTAGTHGQATIDASGRLLRYQIHTKGWSGIDRFSYRVVDTYGATAWAKVLVHVVDP